MSNNPTPRPYDCPKCGQVHKRCLGHSARHKGPCGQQPLNGSDMCRTHGNGFPQVKAVAAARVQRAELVAMVQEYALPVDVEPHVAIMQEIARSNGAVLWLAEIVAQIPKAEFTWGKSYVDKRVSKEGDGPQVAVVNERETAGKNIWVQLYQEERKHLADICAKAVALGLAAKQIDMARSYGEQLVAIFRAVFEDAELALDPETQERARRVAARHLHVVPAPPA